MRLFSSYLGRKAELIQTIKHSLSLFQIDTRSMNYNQNSYIQHIPYNANNASYNQTYYAAQQQQQQQQQPQPQPQQLYQSAPNTSTFINTLSHL